MKASGASSPGGKYSVRGVRKILGCALAVVGAAGAKSFFFSFFLSWLQSQLVHVFESFSSRLRIVTCNLTHQNAFGCTKIN